MEKNKANLKEERKLWKGGYNYIAGLDEAGRGPLAGPVVAAAVMIDKKSQFKIRNSLKEVKDSKKLSPKKREKLYKILINFPQIEWGIGRVTEKVIDRINILEATKLAMKRAVKHLERKMNKKVGYLILDGNIKISLDVPQRSIKKADNKVFSCAAASIIAKVRRDRAMERYHKKYLKYGFNRHKGYATKLHRKMLRKFGPCKLHRKTFKPVKSLPK
jgi:ribonuclease HII